MTDSIPLITPPSARLRPALQGGVAILPLCLAVVPWGVLAGSMALQSGLTPAQGLGMSAIVFAGASQLVAMGMIKGSAGLLAILLSTFFVTAQHFLYALRLRERIAPLPLRWRLALGFLLTDELFALTGEQTPARFNRWYALGAGLTFYLCWFLSTLLGIVAAGSAGDLDGYGLDFSIAATFIAIVVPLVRSLPVLACVLTALLLSIVLHHFQTPGALVIATVAAMLVGLLCSGGAPMIWLTIVLMGLVVFFNRYCFLAPGLPLRLSPRVKTLLSFSVPAVLTAICGPIVAFSGDQLRAAPDNPYLWGAVFAVILAFFLRNMLAVVLLSMLIFIALRGIF